MASIDRLSSLPDDVIYHILSFLPTKESVETSVLAKRYRFLWTYVPSLYFDSETSFVYMISRVMLLSKALSINTFHISPHCVIDSRKFELETWLTTTVERNVQTLFLDFGNCLYREKCLLPLCIFSCKTLVDLTLRFCNFPSFSSGSITLPSLKSLHLFCTDDAFNDALPCLLSCCPVLDKLFISVVVIGNFYISSHSIKWLSITLINNTVLEHDDPVYELKLYAPALKYLKVIDSCMLVISCHTPTLLNEANILYDHTRTVYDGDYFFKMISFLESLGNARCLKLCRGLALLFFDGVKSITRFDNLTQLEFEGDWLFLMNLIESAENLGILIINEVYEDGEKWMEPKQVPTCVFSRLRTVRLNKDCCGEQMVGYLLRNARVLERIEIYSKHGWFGSEDKQDVLQKISMFEPGSVAYKIYFVECLCLEED